MNGTDVTVTAGLFGFFALFLLGVAVWFLARDMSRRLRNVRNDHDKGGRGPGPGRPEEPQPPGG